MAYNAHLHTASTPPVTQSWPAPDTTTPKHGLAVVPGTAPAAPTTIGRPFPADRRTISVRIAAVLATAAFVLGVALAFVASMLLGPGGAGGPGGPGGTPPGVTGTQSGTGPTAST